MLNPQLNIPVLANAYSQMGAISIQNAFQEEVANALQNELSELNWILQIKDYTQTDRLEIPLSEIENKDNLVDVLYSRKHDIDLDKLFYIRLAVDNQDDLKSGHIGELSKFMNSDEFIHPMRQIVGNPEINNVWMEATCYDKGCFLGSHCDDHHPDNRVAFVYNLTKTWKLDWGALLLLEANPNGQPIIVPPVWNSLSMFNVPVSHTVSCVSAAATEHRYSITGWLRP